MNKNIYPTNAVQRMLAAKYKDALFSTQMDQYNLIRVYQRWLSN